MTLISGGRRSGAGSDKVGDRSVIQSDGKEGGDFGKEECFFGRGDGTAEEDGHCPFDHVAFRSGSGGGAGICAE